MLCLYCLKIDKSEKDLKQKSKSRHPDGNALRTGHYRHSGAGGIAQPDAIDRQRQKHRGQAATGTRVHTGEILFLHQFQIQQQFPGDTVRAGQNGFGRRDCEL